MNAIKTGAERVADLRERRKAAGLARLEVYAHPEDHALVRAYVAKLLRKRAKEKPGG